LLCVEGVHKAVSILRRAGQRELATRVQKLSKLRNAAAHPDIGLLSDLADFVASREEGCQGVSEGSLGEPTSAGEGSWAGGTTCESSGLSGDSEVDRGEVTRTTSLVGARGVAPKNKALATATGSPVAVQADLVVRGTTGKPSGTSFDEVVRGSASCATSKAVGLPSDVEYGGVKNKAEAAATGSPVAAKGAAPQANQASAVLATDTKEAKQKVKRAAAKQKKVAARTNAASAMAATGKLEAAVAFTKAAEARQA
jgi:hypothetical protein